MKKLINLFFIIAYAFIVGCSGESGPTIVPNFPIPKDLQIKGYLNLSNVAVHPDLGGIRPSLLDHSGFKISVQDDVLSPVNVTQDGNFSLPAISIRDQVVLVCKDSNNPNFILEWMAADSNGLLGNKNIEISLNSTARSLVARSLRDRYGRRIKPESLETQHINTTVEALANVLEQHPEKLNNQPLNQVAEVKAAYTSMADQLHAGESGIFPNQWVFMIYIGGDNNLYSYLAKNLSEITEVGVQKDAKIVIQADIYPDGAKRYLVAEDKLLELAELGNIDSTNSNYLADFVGWTKRTFPAKNYSLIISSHGSGWKNEAIRGSLISDNTSGTIGNPVLIGNALKYANQTFDGQQRPLELLAFDACNMGSIEIAYEFQTVANFTVFSQAKVPATGFPYKKIFEQVKTKELSGLTDETLVQIICDSYDEEYSSGVVAIPYTISAVKNSELQGFIDSLNAYGNAVIANIGSYKSVINSLRDSKLTLEDGQPGYVVQAFEDSDFRDFKDFMLESRNSLPAVKIQADLLLPKFDKIIFRSHKSSRLFPDSYGISISLPASSSYINNYMASGTVLYSNFQFAQKTTWDELLDLLNKN
jgi:hypothetical protein